MNEKQAQKLWWGIFSLWAITGAGLWYAWGWIVGLAWIVSALVFPTINKTNELLPDGVAQQHEIINPNDEDA